MDQDDILAIFFQECDEGLAVAESGLAALAGGAADAEGLNAVFRAVHSIKGGAGAFGFDALVRYAHLFETVLDHLRAGRLAHDLEVVRLLQRSRDVLDDHVHAAQNGGAAPDDSGVVAELSQLAADPGAAPTVAASAEAPAAAEPDADEFGFMPVTVDLDSFNAPAETPWLVRFRPLAGAMAHGNDPLLLLRELERMGALEIRLDETALADLAVLDPCEPGLAWEIEMPGDTDEQAILDVFDFVIDDCELSVARKAENAAVLDLPADLADTPAPADQPAAESRAAAAAAAAAPPAGERPSIRVDLDRVDQLVNLVGELVITQSMMAQRVKDLNLDLSEELDDLSHLTREMQDAVMAMRAQPVRTAFARVPRLLRDLELETGKSVRLDVSGETTEVDKTVVDRIGEPLVHLIRNAVDHGLEAPADRVAAGKPEQGVIRLAAEHRSGRIVITVADDGRGIDRARVRAKAVERGILAPDATPSDEEIDNLIFAPGFSTAERVSNISGRGVGLDVVRRNVASFGGRVTLASTPGQGSVFSLTLPLTLAVLDGMVVRSGGDTYVIPLANIVECIRPAPGQIRAVGSRPDVLELRGMHLPIVDLGAVLRGENGDEGSETAFVIVDCEHLGRAALRVDSIDDQRQVVIKSLEANFRAVAGLAGATTLGDGKVALILDPESLIAMARTPAAALSLAA
ncbi:MAG: chemotaxis protein CheA [Alphaproteobacteria bacterium]|nr:chemotaxis protein CheA [Alphaproteobacteria bacterium]